MRPQPWPRGKRVGYIILSVIQVGILMVVTDAFLSAENLGLQGAAVIGGGLASAFVWGFGTCIMEDW